MKVQVSKQVLQAAVARVQGATVERNLSQFGIKAEGTVLTVSGADRVIAIYSEFQCETWTPGHVYLPAKLFADVVRELPEGSVHLEKKGSFLELSAGTKDEFQMKLPIGEELPWRDPPKIPLKHVAQISSIRMAYMIEQVQFCLAEDSPRVYGTVGYLHSVANNRLRLLGTDGFRLSYCDTEGDFPPRFLDSGISISKKTLGEIARMCSEGVPEITLGVSEDGTTLFATIEGYQLFARLSVVDYPDYKSVLTNPKHSAQNISKAHFNAVVRRVLLAADRTRSLQLSFSGSSLTLSSRTVGSCEGKESIPLEGYRGPHCTIAVNGKFVSDIIASVVGEHLAIHFKDPEEPIIVVPQNELEGCQSQHVLMPIKETT